MIRVLTNIRIIKHIAHDVHYRSNDQWFYALHLLADKVDFGSAEDELKEAYWLGEKEVLPPTDVEIEKLATEKIGDFKPENNQKLIEKLHEVCTDGIYTIEEVKRTNPFAGVHAILDGISQKMLVIRGLCWRTLNGDGEEK